MVKHILCNEIDIKLWKQYCNLQYVLPVTYTGVMRVEVQVKFQPTNQLQFVEVQVQSRTRTILKQSV